VQDALKNSVIGIKGTLFRLLLEISFQDNPMRLNFRIQKYASTHG